MDLFINEQKVDFKLDSEKTLGDVLKEIQKDCEKNEATVFSIEVNGNLVTADKLEEVEKNDLGNVKTLKVSTIAKSDIKGAFKSIGEAIPDITVELEQVSVYLQTGKDTMAFEAVKRFTTLFDNFCRVVSLSALFQEDFSLYKIVDKTIQDFLSDFSPILNDFETALKDKDTVLIGDLSEYEILPRIQEIQIFCNGIN